MMVFRNSLLLACLFSFSCAWAQNRIIDSLSLVLSQAPDGQAKADLQHTLAQEIFNHDYEKGLAYARESLSLSQKSAYPRGEAQALTAIGNYYFYKGEYPAALSQYTKAVRVIGGQEAADYPAKTYLRISILYRQQAYFDSAHHYLEKARTLLPQGQEGGLHAAYYASSGILANKMSRNDQALQFLKQSLNIRKTLGDSSRLADTWRALGDVYTAVADYDSAEHALAQAQRLIGPDTDPEVQMLIHLSQGETHFARGNYDQAIEQYNKALDRLRINTYQRHYAHLLFRIGELYEKQGAYHTAFEYFFAAIKEFEKINARQSLARTYSLIGWSYNYQENYPLALENAAKSLLIAREIGDSASIAQNKNLIGYAALKQGRLAEAWQSLEEALAIRTRIQNWWGATYTLYNMGQVQQQLGQQEKALHLFNRALETSKRIGHKSAFVFINNKLGEWYTQNGQYEQAAHYLAEARDMAKKIALPTQRLVTYKNYIALYDQQQDAEKTVYYFKAYTALSDSLNAALSAGHMAKADALFQLQEKTAELQLVTTEKELQHQKIMAQQAEIRFQRNIIGLVGGSVLLLLTLLVVIFRLYRKNREAQAELKQQYKEIQDQQEEILVQSEELIETNSKLAYLNDELNKKNQEIALQSDRVLMANSSLEKVVSERTVQLDSAYKELETFFYRTSHDFRRPLTTFLGLVEVANHSVQDQQAISLFEKVRETTLALDKMLLKLQSIGSQELEANARMNLHTLLTSCEEKFAPELFAKGIRLHLSCDDCLVTVNHHLLLTVLENLVENAITFSTPASPYIKLYAGLSQGGTMLHLQVEDNGQGIPPHIQPRIFDMYFRGSVNSQGNGLGLYIARRAVEKLGGSIQCSSRLHKGSTFTVLIPHLSQTP